MTLGAELKQLIDGEVNESEADRERCARDASVFYVKPAVVVYPRDTEDVKRLVHWASAARRAGRKVSLTPRSAGTDMTGGPLTESVVLDLTRHFNQVKTVGEDYAVVEPGVYYRDFERATLAQGLLLPSYPASRELCTVGGMVANNSGGEKTLRYGKTERYVRQLKMVLSDGEEHTFTALDPSQLPAAAATPGLAGRLYRELPALIQEHASALAAAKPQVTKNSSGYFLWNVINPANGAVDLTKLLVGSQGTLGIITEITFRLIRPEPASRLLVIFLKDRTRLSELTQAVLRYKPESFESYDDHTFRLAIKFWPEILGRVKGNLFKIILGLLPELWLVLRHGLPKLVLLAEFTGPTAAAALRQAKLAYVDLKPRFPYPMRVTQSDEEAKEFFAVRRESFNLLRQHVRGRRTAPFIDDFAIRPEYLPEFLTKLEQILNRYRLLYTIAGHVGDGNFHIIPLMDFRDPQLPRIIRELSQQVYDLVLTYHGTITAEHNDGLIRTPFLLQEYGPVICQLFAQTKKLFDPDNIFNPGKKVGTTLDQALSRLDLPRHR